VTVTPSVGTYENGVWTIPSLANGAVATLTITGTAVPQSTIINNATRVSQTEYKNEQNSTESSIYVPEVDIVVLNRPWQYYPTTGKYEDKYDVNNTPVFLLEVRNSSTYDDATGVEIKYEIGSGFDFIGFNDRGYGGNPTYNNGVITWKPDKIPRGGSVALMVYLKVKESGNKTATLTTTAQLTHVDQQDMNNANNVYSYAIITPKAADIQVNQTYETFTMNGKQYVTYIITTRNNGPDNATGVQITDQLPAGLEYYSHTISYDNGSTWNNNDSSYNTNTGVWNIGNFNFTDQPKILKITAEITGNGTIKNRARRTAINEYDWNLNNNSETTILRKKIKK